MEHALAYSRGALGTCRTRCSFRAATLSQSGRAIGVDAAEFAWSFHRDTT